MQQAHLKVIPDRLGSSAEAYAVHTLIASAAVLGEQIGVWALETKINVARAASVCLVGESWGRKHPSETN
jgi:hypothetical protein